MNSLYNSYLPLLLRFPPNLNQLYVIFLIMDYLQSKNARGTCGPPLYPRDLMELLRVQSKKHLAGATQGYKAPDLLTWKLSRGVLQSCNQVILSRTKPENPPSWSRKIFKGKMIPWWEDNFKVCVFLFPMNITKQNPF